MKNLSSAFIYLITSTAVVALSGCEESFLTDQQTIRLNKTFYRPEGIDGYTDLPNGERVPYPTIIKQTYIPSNDLFAHTKCLAWKISWPDYPVSIDSDKIPTVFATGKGTLNSFNYLNNTNPQNTYDAEFSLYYGDKVEAAIMMWEDLDYRDITLMETVYFYKTDKTAKTIEDWVKERPSLFQTYWQNSNEIEANYQAGDIFLYKQANKNLYGGIRIVSMNPRVIEIYLAVPNE